MEYKPLKEIARITMGQSPESSSYNSNQDGLPFFQGNADFGEVYPQERVWCNDPKKVAQTDDILISVRAPIGALNYAKTKCCIGRGLAAITVNNASERSYIFHLLKARNTELNSKGTGSTFKAIGKSVLEELQVPVISHEKQAYSMQLMDLTESIISRRKKEFKLLDDLIKARFVEMFGDMLINPRDWPEHRLDSLSDIVSGITKGRKVKTDELYEVPYMAVSNVKDGYIDWTTVKSIMATEKEIDQYRLMPGDVLMTEGGDPDKLGRGAIIHEPPKDCIHQNHIFRVRLKQDVLLSIFMAQYLQQQKAKRYFLGCAKQTTGIASINMRQLSALPVLVPPMKEQKEYASFVAQVDKSKFEVQRALDETQKLFDSLMQEYFG